METGLGLLDEYSGDSTELTYLRSRQYSPRIGRFLTKDIWGENANFPMSHNSWLYVYANSINLTDPSGKYPAECLEAEDFYTCLSNWHMPDNYAESDVTYASSILRNVYDIQKIDYQGETYDNLCGHFSVEIVIEAIQHGEPFHIHKLIDLLNTDKGTDFAQLGRLLVQAIGSQAQVYSYYGDKVQEYTVDSNGKPHAFDSKRARLNASWWSDEHGNNIALQRMSGIMREGHYIIVCVVLDTRTGYIADHVQEKFYIDPKTKEKRYPRYVGHWVVVKRISGNTITIVNPFDNRIESYSWSGLFKGSMERIPYWLLEIAPKH